MLEGRASAFRQGERDGEREREGGRERRGERNFKIFKKYGGIKVAKGPT